MIQTQQHKKTYRLFLIVFLCCFLPSALPDPLFAAQPAAATGLIDHGGYILAGNPSMAIAENAATPFVPASTLKIITALAALEILGPDHRFATRISRDHQNNLYVQGGGDPFLLTEHISSIAKKLYDSGVRQIGDLIIDDSVFALDTVTDGCENTTNPYDAWNSGLAVNFNSIAIKVAADHSISPDDPKVPMLPMMKAIGATLPPGHHHVNVNAFTARGRLSNTQRYTGELFTALLQQQQIRATGKIKAGLTPPQAAPILTYRSELTVRDMLGQCLKYSNNFVANQLFLACGAKRFGPPATWDKGRAALQAFIKEDLGVSEAELMMVEGSGLSRNNRITPRAMITALRKFSPYRDLLPVKKGVPLKSGTLTGVYCYAGYLPLQEDAPFVILLNQPQNNRDEILHLLVARGDASKTMTAGR
jgi:D-alanyl-D-alanine carboxypeptidase/D-alanyl-D-alanine-endopeptidase (penicillin-binding protein 4)